jgi:hypothetical protein
MPFQSYSTPYYPNSEHPQYLSPEPAQPEMCRVPDQSGTRSVGLEELNRGSQLCSQPQDEAEGGAIPLGQALQEKVVDEMGEVEEGNS